MINKKLHFESKKQYYRRGACHACNNPNVQRLFSDISCIFTLL